jgi:hypothetical protein
MAAVLQFLQQPEFIVDLYAENQCYGGDNDCRPKPVT